MVSNLDTYRSRFSDSYADADFEEGKKTLPFGNKPVLV